MTFILHDKKLGKSGKVVCKVEKDKDLQKEQSKKVDKNKTEVQSSSKVEVESDDPKTQAKKAKDWGRASNDPRNKN